LALKWFTPPENRAEFFLVSHKVPKKSGKEGIIEKSIEKSGRGDEVGFKKKNAIGAPAKVRTRYLPQLGATMFQQGHTITDTKQFCQNESL
jgi:hypothetical protein